MGQHSELLASKKARTNLLKSGENEIEGVDAGIFIGTRGVVQAARNFHWDPDEWSKRLYENSVFFAGERENEI